MSRATRILVVDDERSIREIIRDFMEMQGWDVHLAANGEDALKKLASNAFDVVVTDLKMSNVGGIQVLEAAKERDPYVAVLVMTGFGTVESAIESMKKGAFDYILKPFKMPDLVRVVGRAIEQRKLQLENLHLKELVGLYDVTELLGRTLSLDEVADVLVDAMRDQLGCDAVCLAMAPLAGKADGQSAEFTGRRTGHLARELAFDVARFWARDGLSESALRVAHELRPHELIARCGDQTAVVLRSEEILGCVEDPEAARASELSAIVAFALRGRDGVIGVMSACAFHEQHRFSEGRTKMLSMLAGRGAAAIDNARLYEDLKVTFWQTIQGLANILESKDPYTRGHSERVKLYAGMLAEGLGLAEDHVERIREAALLHDIGKLCIRVEDLNKAGPLTPSEYEMFKSHTTRGKWLLEPIAFLHNVIPGIYHHHERWDGKGYPIGLSGTDIPLDARIMSLADSYDAMTSNRAYRRALPHEVAVSEIVKNSGSQFDPDLAHVFVRVIEEHKAGHRERQRRWTEILERGVQRPETDRDAGGA